jgi:Na+/melibiose symporter-like transporter
VPVAKWVDRSPSPRPFIGTTFLLFAVFPIFLVVLPKLSVALGVPVMVGLIVTFIVNGLREIGEPARKALIVDLAEPLHRGRTVGLYYSIRGFSVAGAAAIGGALWTVRPSLTFLVAAGLGALGTLFAAAFLPSGSSTPLAEAP